MMGNLQSSSLQTEPTADGGDDYRAQAALCAQRRHKQFAKLPWRLNKQTETTDDDDDDDDDDADDDDYRAQATLCAQRQNEQFARSRQAWSSNKQSETTYDDDDDDYREKEATPFEQRQNEVFARYSQMTCGLRKQRDTTEDETTDDDDDDDYREKEATPFAQRQNELSARYSQMTSRLGKQTETTDDDDDDADDDDDDDDDDDADDDDYRAQATLCAQRQNEQFAKLPWRLNKQTETTDDDDDDDAEDDDYRAQATLCAQRQIEQFAEDETTDDDDDDYYREKEATPFSQRRNELSARYSQMTSRLGKQTETIDDDDDDDVDDDDDDVDDDDDDDDETTDDDDDDDDDVAEDYRAQATLCVQRRNELFTRSRQAWRLGQKAKAKSLSDAAKAQQKLMAEANKKAAETLFNNHNAKRDVGVIDLHGLFVKEAIARVEERIALCKEMGRKDLVVIVGRGNHSKDGKAILKPMVQQFMQEYGLSITAGKPNDGCIYVQFDNRLQLVESCALK